MATAIEVLKAATSQLQISSPLGRWAQKISFLLSSSGVANPQWLIAKRANSNQSGVGILSVVLFNAFAADGIDFNTATGSAFLTPGKTYRITAHGAADSFSDPVNGRLDFKLVDDNNNPLQQITGANGLDSPQATLVPSTNAAAGNPIAESPIVEMIWTVPANAGPKERTVKVLCTGASGTANLFQGSWTLVIQEIPG